VTALEVFVVLALVLAGVGLCWLVAIVAGRRRARGRNVAPMASERAPKQIESLPTIRLRSRSDDPNATRVLRWDLYPRPEPQAQVAGIAAFLVLPGDRRTPLPRESRVVLGRRGDIVVGDVQVSRKHATIRADPGTQVYRIEDLKSISGTYVNGQRISSPHKLVSGDHIKLGPHTELTFLSTGSR
jgi:hypothetical protein